LAGTSVALSADASTIAVGSWLNPLQVLRADDDGEYIVQISPEKFAHAVDLSADGKTIICTSTSAECEEAECIPYTPDYDGYVRVFSLESDSVLGTDSWNQIGEGIAGTIPGGAFGKIVAITNDGKTIAVSSGGRSNLSTGLWDSDPVRRYRLAKDGLSWEQIGDYIYGDLHGNSLVQTLSLSADGSTIAIGGSFEDDNNGEVKVYRFNSGGGNWEQLGQSIHSDDEWGWFGSNIQLSNDGNTLVAGMQPDGNHDGYARVYSLMSNGNSDTNTWKQIGQDFIIEYLYYMFFYGWPVFLSDDGKTLAVGNPNAVGENVYESLEAGHVTVYRMDDLNSGWMQLGDPIKGEETYEYSGCSVWLSGDGNKVVIEYTNQDESERRVRTYVLG